MASEAFITGTPLSSTPIQSYQDSGYFGSSQRRSWSASNVKVLNACSPIKELSFKNFLPKNPCLNHDPFLSQHRNKSVFDSENFTKLGVSSGDKEASELLPESGFCSPGELYNSSQKNTENVSSLNYQSPFYDFSEYRESLGSFGSLLENEDIKYKLFPEILPKNKVVSTVDDVKSSVHLPSSISLDSEPYPNSKSLVVPKCGISKINFIHEFRKRNCSLIISDILSYLSAEELCRSSCVSKEWNEAILEDRKANSRKQQFIKEKKIFFTGPSKENRLGMRSGPAREHKNAFSNLTNTDKSSVYHINKKSSKTRFDSFIDEVKNGYQKLLKCPKCFYASKNQNGSHYICTQCSYRFCPDCLGPILNNHTCYKQGLPKTIIGSKQSKKNLKRL